MDLKKSFPEFLKDIGIDDELRKQSKSLRAYFRYSKAYQDADELTQETIVRAMKNWKEGRLGEIRTADDLRKYLHGIAFRVLREFWRDRNKHSELPVEIIDEKTDIGKDIDKRYQFWAVQQCLDAALDSRERDLLEYHF